MNDSWIVLEGYEEQPNKTYLIDQITSYSESLNELENSKDLFQFHVKDVRYLKSGPLRQCRTIHLSTGDKKLSPDENKLLEMNKKLPKTCEFLSTLKLKVDPLNMRKIGRSYVTILKPGGRIFPHSDTYQEYWNEVDRFQFYYTGHIDVDQIIGKQKFEIQAGFFYFFDHKQIHEYHNRSEIDVYLLVFDLFKL